MGLIIFSNQDAFAMLDGLGYHLLDHLRSDKPLKDTFSYCSEWVNIFHDISIKLTDDQQKETDSNLATRIVNTKPHFSLEEYAGTYRDIINGDLFVKVEGDSLRINFDITPRLYGLATHFHHETFHLKLDKRLFVDCLVTFNSSANAKVSSCKFKCLGEDWLNFSTFDFKKL